MLNNVNLCGRIVNDLELKSTNNGKLVISFAVAVDRNYSKDDKQTDFINIVAWQNTADFISRYFHKGKMIIINGSIQVRDYTDKNGAKRYVTEVIANNVYFAGDNNKTANLGDRNDNINISNDSNDFEEIQDDDELPF